MEEADSNNRPPVNEGAGRAPRRDPLTMLAIAAGIVSLVLVGGTTVAVLIVLVVSAPEAGPQPVASPSVLPPPLAPGEPDPDPLAEAEKTLRTQRERIHALELEVLRLKERLKSTEPEAVERLANRLLSGDPESARGARAILIQRGGSIGKVLADRILALRARTVEMEALSEIEKKMAEAAVRDLMAERRKARDEAGKREKERAADFYDLGLKAQESGHHALAERYFSSALDIDPALAGALNGRGLVRLALSNPTGALMDFTTASTLREDFAPYHFNRGRALEVLERWDAAVSAFDRVLALDPGNADALVARNEAVKRKYR